MINRMAATTPRTVDDYIAGVPAEVRPKLEELRAAIRSAAPDAVERISYGMPAYHLNGRLIYFAAHKHHIGLYPADPAEAAAAGLSEHLAAKSTLQFPLDQPLPTAAIRRLIERRVRGATQPEPDSLNE